MLLLSLAMMAASNGKSDARVKATCTCNTPAGTLPDCHRTVPVSGESIGDAQVSCGVVTDKTGHLTDVQEYAEKAAPLKCSGLGPHDPKNLVNHASDELDGAYATRLCVPTSSRPVAK